MTNNPIYNKPFFILSHDIIAFHLTLNVVKTCRFKQVNLE